MITMRARNQAVARCPGRGGCSFVMAMKPEAFPCGNVRKKGEMATRCLGGPAGVLPESQLFIYFTVCSLPLTQNYTSNYFASTLA